MELLLRMCEKQKWEKIDYNILSHTSTPADTITTELKTHSNTLSLWKIDNKNKEAFLKGVLAIAVSRNQITRLDVMIFDFSEIEKKGLILKNTPENGDSPFEEYNINHFDVIEMNYEKLGNFSELIINNISDPEKCIRFDKGQISNLLYDGYKKKYFLIEALDNKLSDEFKKVLKRKQAVEQ